MNLSQVNADTKALVEQGHKLFQIHRFAENECLHVARLERWAEFDINSAVIDLGSGTGEMARIMNAIRPDLTFTLVNVSQFQLDYSDRTHNKICCDFLHIPVPDESFDAAMFCFAIGHEDIAEALKEAYRVLKNDGVLFIYDMVRISGNNTSMVDVEYEVHPKSVMDKVMLGAGFTLDFYMEPSDTGDYGRGLFGDDFDRVFSGTIPAIWRLTK